MSEGLATLHDDLQDLLGQTVAGRYRIGALIGVGGMAAVFRVEHLGLGREMAFKVLHPQLTAHAEVSARFDREAKSASRLDHPNCVQVTDYGSTEHGMKFMIMQLLEGRELRHVIEEGAIEPLRALDLTVQILRGLEHAHKQGVVHRDIKPENVFVTTDHDGHEVLKLVDFGIAKIVDATIDDKHKTLAGMVFGTPAYMSPEQAMGVEADVRSDLYSTGVMLYQMLSGKLPFDNEDPVALVRMQVSADAAPLPPSVPPLLSATVARLLQKDRDKRFQTASEVLGVLEALRTMLGGGDVSGPIQAANTSGPIYLDSSRQILVDPSGQILVDGSGQIAAIDPTRPLELTRAKAWERLRARTTKLSAIILGRPRWQLYIGLGAGAVLLGAFVMWLARGDRDRSNASALGPIVVEADDDDGEAAVPGDEAIPFEEVPVGDDPDASQVAEIDRLLAAKKVAEADALLSTLRDEFPENAQLSWRQGKILALSKRKEAQALAAYGKAVELDPTLLDDAAFVVELDELMRNPKVRDEALDLALQQMGHHGHPFLLEQVNDERKPLGYTDRKRALADLAEDPSNVEQVNRQLNLALDVLQASESRTPCASYREALDSIASAPDFYYFTRVEKAKVPEAPPVAEGEAPSEDAVACDGLTQRRAEVLELLAPLAPEDVAIVEDPETGEPTTRAEPTEPEPAPAKTAPSKGRKPTPKKRKSTSSSSSSSSKSKCKKVGAIFKKDCWKRR